MALNPLEQFRLLIAGLFEASKYILTTALDLLSELQAFKGRAITPEKYATVQNFIKISIEARFMPAKNFN